MLDQEVALLGGIEKSLSLNIFAASQYGSAPLYFLKNVPSLKRAVMILLPPFHVLDGRQEDLSKLPRFYDGSPKFRHLTQIFSASLPYIGKFLLAYFMDTPSVEERKVGTYWFGRCCAEHLPTKPKDLEKLRSACISRREVIPQIKEFLDTHDLEVVEKRFNTVERSFSYSMEVMSSMSHVQFDIIISPCCSAVWASGQEPILPESIDPELQNYIGGLLYILDHIEAFPNIRLYAFDDVAEIVGNTANYFEQGHYGIGVNRYILRSIKAGKHRITKANVLEYLRRVVTVILNFDPTPDYEHTVTFEGPLTEESEQAFSRFPPPTGPSPLLP
jgi:hypothetical protein